MKEITDPGKKGHKKKTKHNDIHKKPTPVGAGKTLQPGPKWRVCALSRGIVKRRLLPGRRTRIPKGEQ